MTKEAWQAALSHQQASAGVPIDLITAIEEVLRADTTAMLNGGGAYARHLPEPLIKLRKAFKKAMLAAAPTPPAQEREPFGILGEAMNTPDGYVSHDAYRGAMERAYAAEREVHRLSKTTPSPDQQAEIDRLRAELEEVQKDAERYRFLRTSRPIHEATPFIARNFGAGFSQWTLDMADEAIDAAIAAEEK